MMIGALFSTQWSARELAAFGRGLEACGDRVAGADDLPDFVACWGMRSRIPDHLMPLPRLYLEAGYINGAGPDYVENRLRFVSLSWDGMHGLSRPIGPVDSRRWDALELELRPWHGVGHRALLLKQHPGDAVVFGPDYEGLRRALHWQGCEVIEREHPLVGRARPLAEDLARCDFAVTYCSTAAVEAVIAGIPTVTLNRISIAWPVTGHALEERFTGDRLPWCHELAYRQWTLDELASGAAWAYYRAQGAV